MSELLGGDGSDPEIPAELRQELLDGPQPGFRRVTTDEEKAIAAEDKAVLDELAQHFGGDEDRGIGPHVILSQE